MIHVKDENTVESRLKKFDILKAEANTVREKDKNLIRSLFKNLYKRRLIVGIGFQRAYGSILSGDHFDLIRLTQDTYMFVFADVSGHGLPAYTTLIRLRSAITLAVNEMRKIYETTGLMDHSVLISNIAAKFTDIMDESNSDDFACVNFTIVQNKNGKFHLEFYNRSMLFPIVVRRKGKKDYKIENLNYPQENWIPSKGYLLGSDIRALLGDSYLDNPRCTYTLNEGDAIMYYSDGIIEAYRHDSDRDEFGDEGVEEVLLDYAGLHPQLAVDGLFRAVYDYLGAPEHQKDDMTAVMICFPKESS